MSNSKERFAKIIQKALILGMISLGVIIIWFEIRMGSFIYVSKWKYIVEDFDSYQKDFIAVADFCGDYIAKKTEEDENAYHWISYSRQQLYYNGEALQVSEELKESIIRIEEAFPNKDAKLDSIWCYGHTVYFSTDHGQYSLVYSPDGKPVSMDGREKTDIYKRKIVDDWYHVVRK